MDSEHDNEEFREALRRVREELGEDRELYERAKLEEAIYERLRALWTEPRSASTTFTASGGRARTRCSTCGGTGQRECSTCDGRGEYRSSRYDRIVSCDVCGGRGHVRCRAFRCDAGFVDD